MAGIYDQYTQDGIAKLNTLYIQKKPTANDNLIQVTTADKSALILQTTDDDATEPLFKTFNAAGNSFVTIGGDHQVLIEASGIAKIPLTLKQAAGQTESLFEILTSGDNPSFQVKKDFATLISPLTYSGTSPSITLQLQRTYNHTSGVGVGFQSSFSYTPPATAGAQMRGTQFTVTKLGSQANTAGSTYIQGALFQAGLSGSATGDFNKAEGGSFFATNDMLQDTLSLARAGLFTIRNNDGDITLGQALYIPTAVNGTGEIVTMVGLDIEDQNVATNNWAIRTGLGLVDIGDEVLITAPTTTTVPLTLKAAASQTANLTEWQNSSGTALTSINASGHLILTDDAALTPIIYGSDSDTGIGFDGGTLRLSGGSTGQGTLTISGASVAIGGVPLSIQGGSISDLGLSFSNDPDTGFYRSFDGGGAIAFVSDGSLIARIKQAGIEIATGGLGIGIDPVEELHIFGDRPGMRFEDDGGGYTLFRSSIDGGFSLSADDANTEAGTDMVFKVDGTEVFRLNSNLRMGINDTGPDAKLDIVNEVTTVPVLILEAAASATANIHENHDSSSNVLSGFDERGIPFAHGNTSTDNYFAGNNAGNVATTGIDNTAIGDVALAKVTSGDYNSAFGSQALNDVTEGSFNHAFGFAAGTNITTGANNFAMGWQSLNTITTTSNNMGLGLRAGRNLVGTGNAGIGYQALGGNSAGTVGTSTDYNVAIGYRSHYNIQAASDRNVTIGAEAGYTGALAGNIFLGYRAGYYQTGSNVLLVANQQYADAATELTNSLLYGVMAATPANQTLRINADTSVYGSLNVGDGTNQLVISNTGDLSLEGTAIYERHIQIPALLVGNASNSPSKVDFFTVGALQFSSAVSKTTFCQWEIPDDWDGTNIIFEVDWFPDSGATTGTDTVKWDVEYRALAEGETINNGTSVTVSSTDSGDYAQYETKHAQHILAFDSGDQPLTAQDHLFFKISRDVAVTDDFSGTISVPAFEIIYQSTGFPGN